MTHTFCIVRFKDSLNATKPQGAISDLVDVVKKQHTNAKIKNQPCSGIIYVHKRQDCQALAAQISKVRFVGPMMTVQYNSSVSNV